MPLLVSRAPLSCVRDREALKSYDVTLPLNLFDASNNACTAHRLSRYTSDLDFCFACVVATYLIY